MRQEVTDLRHDRDQVAEHLEQQQVAVAEQRQRAEIAEKAYLALRHTLLDGHVLRSGDRPS